MSADLAEVVGGQIVVGAPGREADRSPWSRRVARTAAKVCAQLCVPWMPCQLTGARQPPPSRSAASKEPGGEPSQGRLQLRGRGNGLSRDWRTKSEGLYRGETPVFPRSRALVSPDAIDPVSVQHQGRASPTATPGPSLEATMAHQCRQVCGTSSQIAGDHSHIRPKSPPPPLGPASESSCRLPTFFSAAHPQGDSGQYLRPSKTELIVVSSVLEDLALTTLVRHDADRHPSTAMPMESRNLSMLIASIQSLGFNTIGSIRTTRVFAKPSSRWQLDDPTTVEVSLGRRA